MKKRWSIFVVLLFSIHGNSFAQSAPRSEEQFKAFFQQHLDALDPIEGIWSVTTTRSYYRHDTLLETEKIPNSIKVAIIAKGERKFDTYDLKGDPSNVVFTATEVKGVYFYQNYFSETGERSETKAIISKNGEMEYEYAIPQNFLKKKLTNSYEEDVRITNVTSWTRQFPAKTK